MKNLFIVNIFSFLLLAACSKSNTECISVSPSRVFNTSGMHFYPETDSISMKDTLWVSINIPKQLKDVLTGESVNYSGGNQIETYIRISSSNIGLDTTFSIKGDGLDYFFICTKTGMSKPSKNYGTPVTYSNSVLQLFATEQDTNYVLNLGLIPKTNGIFLLGTNDAACFRKVDSGDCGAGSLFTMLVSNKSKHFDLIPNILSTMDPYYAARSYMVKVVK